MRSSSVAERGATIRPLTAFSDVLGLPAGLTKRSQQVLCFQQG